MSSTDWQALEDWLIVDRGLAPTTAEKRVELVDRMTRWGYPVGEAPIKQGRAWISHRIQEGQVTNGTINQEVCALNDLLEHRKLEHRFALRKTDGSRVRWLTDTQYDRVLAYRHPEPDVSRMRRALLSVALTTGATRGEIHGLTREDIDRDRRTIDIQRPTKRHKPRKLKLPKWLFSPKRPFIAYLEHRPRLSDDPARDWLWTTTRSSGGQPGGPARRYKRNYLGKLMARIGRELGLDELTFQLTRHTVATRLRRRGAHLLALKEWLGHHSIESTQVYAAVGPAELNQIADQVAEPDPF